jgi:type I restriction enzyme S subunit
MKQGWTISTIGSVAKVFNGNSINAEEKKAKYEGLEEGYPFIATKDVGVNGEVDYDNGVRIPFDTDFKIAMPDAVFVCAEGGSAGKKVAHIDRKVCFGNKLFALQPIKEKVKGGFLYYAVQEAGFKAQFRLSMAGIIGGVSTKKFNSITIPIPPLSEQQRIVSLLDAEFAKIDALKANAEKNLQNAKDLFQATLKKELEPKEGWKWSFLPSISENLDSKRIPITQKDRIAGVYPYYGASGIVDYVSEYLFDDDLLLISEDGANLLARSTPIAFSVSGKIWVNNHAHILKFKDMATQKIVEYYFASILIDEFVTGAAQPKLTQANMNKIAIPIPPTINDQQSIVARLDALNEKCNALQANYEKTLSLCDDLKQALLKKAFNGEI